MDIDFALEGIDKLLRSQELTFGFVGVAPSLAVLYVICGWIRSLWRGELRSKYGNKYDREESFYLIRWACIFVLRLNELSNLLRVTVE